VHDQPGVVFVHQSINEASAKLIAHHRPVVALTERGGESEVTRVKWSSCNVSFSDGFSLLRRCVDQVSGRARCQAVQRMHPLAMSARFSA
jgi:hypothetical protein